MKVLTGVSTLLVGGHDSLLEREMCPHRLRQVSTRPQLEAVWGNGAGQGA